MLVRVLIAQVDCHTGRRLTSWCPLRGEGLVAILLPTRDCSPLRTGVLHVVGVCESPTDPFLT